MSKKQNYLDILRSIEKKPDITQRKMATNLGFSLGKLSYCLKSLQQKGYVKFIPYTWKLLEKRMSSKIFFELRKIFENNISKKIRNKIIH